jgi:ATP-dependent helicase/nuclease subunit B
MRRCTFCSLVHFCVSDEVSVNSRFQPQRAHFRRQPTECWQAAPPLHLYRGVMGHRGTGLPVTMRELLVRGGILLTGNARAARALHRLYAESMQAEATFAWPAPQILDLHSWLTEQWKSLLLTGTEDRLLLNDLQERAHWERLIAPVIIKFSLVEPARMAQLAYDAYGLLANYRSLGRLSESMWMADASAEPEIFRRWARNFQQDCMRQRWIPRCELIDAVTQALQWGTLAPPKEIGWIGFDRETPAERALRAALESRGAAQRELTWEIDQHSPPVLYTAQSERDETAACAEWVRARLAAHPESRIGILMPDLASRRAQLERELYRILSPERFAMSAGPAPALPFEFSLGQPLAQVPLVHAALLLLRWLRAPLMQQELSWLLLSSTLDAAQGARDALARLDAKLRTLRCAPPELALESFLRQPQGGAPAAVALHRDLTAMLLQHRRSPRQATAGEWLRRIARLLQAVRWGERSNTSSLLFQAREAWERMLEQVASLDFFAKESLTYDRMLQILERTAQETIFSPESEDAPVQVMGAYAASGQSFDAVWFLGTTDTAWPAAGRPNPLLPVALQRELGMPHASAAENAALSHRMMVRIAGSSGEIVYSYAQMSDESVQRPSPLVSSFAPASLEAAAPAPRSISLETVADDTWVPLLNAGVSSGGQMPLKRQAECPFQAFVFHRLAVRELPVAGRGLSPADRGSLFHKAMEGIWSEDVGGYTHLTSHADLLNATAAGTLRPLVARHAAAAIRWLGAECGDPWQRAYLKAEEDRTTELVMDWLAIEAARQPFHVAEVEERSSIFVGELALSVRADRIDQVAGGKLLIDYKTGEVSTASWDGPRPEQPQLPLYAAFGHAENLVGAVFAQVRRQKLAFKGRVHDPRTNLSEKLAPKDAQLIEAYNPELVEEWRGTLVDLSESFVHGEAQVDPHVYPKSCQYCPLDGVCRVVELRGTPVPPDTVDDEDTE